MKNLAIITWLSVFVMITITTVLFIKTINAQSTYSKFQEEVVGEINGTLISKFTEPIQGTVCYATSETILNCR